ncbi:dihydrolipoyl dehydrogenase [Anaeramoeba flamelloides]|uniref:Dihydrolipoyl dehydrogenase n=1 Tax=Anaeramoeba flamelloides TaxID=1746091 RepID=A0ABQ8Y187_9EUKA|nr:dihydrolipoyl dehydrogenase [Anaeramoeba flamelloides]
MFSLLHNSKLPSLSGTLFPKTALLRTLSKITEEQDVVIIGGGPGGYVAAIKAAQLGLKVTCVDKRGSFGGTCLNVGCIPSKALLHTTHMYHTAMHEFPKYGIESPKSPPNLKKIMAHKRSAVTSLTKGIEYLFKKNKVSYIKGTATINSANEIDVVPLKKSEDGGGTIKTKNIVIATGSDYITFPWLPVDEEVIVSSTGALSLSQVPKKMIVIGGGVIGLELGTVWKRLGAEVTVVELLNNIGGTLDLEVARELKKQLSRQKMKFLMPAKVTNVTVENKIASVEVQTCCKNPKKMKLEADCVLVSVGRKPYYEGLGLEKIGVQINNDRRINVNDHLQTNIPNIYAIGDVIHGPMLAHKAEEEGVAVVERIADPNKSIILNHKLIPGVVYTDPEVASVGCSEEQLKGAGVEYKVGKFPYMANSRAKAVGDFKGFVKIISHRKTGELLGAHIIGPNASEAIHELALGMNLNCTDRDIGEMCHAHPTLSEAIKEAAMDGYFKAIHL